MNPPKWRFQTVGFFTVGVGMGSLKTNNYRIGEKEPYSIGLLKKRKNLGDCR